MCEWCHHECHCLWGDRQLRFWGVGGAGHPRTWWGPAFGGSPPTTEAQKEYLQEQKAALLQRLKWLDSQLQAL